MTLCTKHSYGGPHACPYCERDQLQTEVENLKFRLSMAESNNPDSVLSKHNAMLMACETRDKLQEELDLCRSQRDDNENAWSCEKQKRIAAESERDTARADVQALADHWQAEIEQHAALQAKVARAVALLENHVLPLCSEEGDIEYAVKQTLEALR